MANHTHPELSLVGRIVTAQHDFPRGEVKVKDGVITAVLSEASPSPREERLDFGEMCLMPGVVDPHVHSLSYAGEGIEAATRSAAAGGVTTILEMPFDAGGPIWTLDAFTAKRKVLENEAHIDAGMYATVQPGGPGIAEIAPMAEAGALCYKVSTYHTDPDRFPRTPDHELLQVFAEIQKAGRRVCVHAENDEIVRSNIAWLNQGAATDPLLHCLSRPPMTETSAVANVLELANGTGVKLHFCHISTPRAVDLVTAARQDGIDVTLETCPQYLTFTEPDLAAKGAWLKCNPPVRDQESVDGLWQRLREGKIHAIASDHAPWPPELKTKPNIFDNASGGPGVETLLPATASQALNTRDVDIHQLVRSTSTGVAEAFGIAHKKGDLRPGLDADIIAFDPTAEWVVDGRALHSNAPWSPFDGYTFRGRVMMTMSRGDIVWDGTSVLSAPGRGRMVYPNV